jgi:hypothetical protein
MEIIDSKSLLLVAFAVAMAPETLRPETRNPETTGDALVSGLMRRHQASSSQASINTTHRPPSLATTQDITRPHDPCTRPPVC